MRLLINAANVPAGGGAVLLSSLIEQIDETGMECILVLDTRYKLQSLKSDKIEVIQVSPNIKSRLLNEFHLGDYADRSDFLLCFGNLPPIFKWKIPTLVYFQNTNLIPTCDLSAFSLFPRWRQKLERIWISLFAGHAEYFAVQLNSTANELTTWLGKKTQVLTLPFLKKSFPVQAAQSEKKYDFLYVASELPHKNHGNLFKAWEILAKKSIYPSLALTIVAENFPNIPKNLKIHFLPNLERREVMELYLNTKALIYPSLSESFGIPLFEAVELGLPILASELPYVRDSIDPTLTFDPHSPESIADSVESFLKNKNYPSVNLKNAPLSPKEFLSELHALYVQKQTFT